MNFEIWMLTAAANAVMVVIYALISISMIRAIISGQQLRSNPLLTATAAVFVTCTLGHGAHLVHAVFATATFWGDGGLGPAEAVRAAFGDMRLVVWDVFTAIVAIYFYTLRSRFAIVYRGAALCEDMEKREIDAKDLQDNVVQGLAHAKMALELGQRDEGYKAIDDTLTASRRIMTELLGQAGSELDLGAGDIRRKAPAGPMP